MAVTDHMRDVASKFCHARTAYGRWMDGCTRMVLTLRCNAFIRRICDGIHPFYGAFVRKTPPWFVWGLEVMMAVDGVGEGRREPSLLQCSAWFYIYGGLVTVTVAFFNAPAACDPDASPS